MRKHIENRHIVDTLFVLTLFAVFSICSMLLIAFGANIYQKTINNYEEHFNISTSVAYINEKIRQNDDSGAIELSSFGSSDAFRITSYYNDVKYYTYIYMDDGYLKELYAKSESKLSPKAGKKLLKLCDDSNVVSAARKTAKGVAILYTIEKSASVILDFECMA